jgi:hypothetical protein
MVVSVLDPRTQGAFGDVRQIVTCQLPRELRGLHYVRKPMHRHSIPLLSYFMVIGSALLACLLLVAHYLEPASSKTSGFAITAAHAAGNTRDEPTTMPMYEKIRLLPIR